MANRNDAPNSAFACVVEIKGKTHRLLRHHTDEVQDGSEHDTVDVSLLKASLNLVGQLKDRGAINEDEYEKARAHLQSHARSIVVDEQPSDINDSQTRKGARRDLENDPDMARRIVSEQAGGPSGNQNLENPRVDETLDDDADNTLSRRAEENLRQEGGSKGSITGKGSTPTKPAEKSTENPAGVKGDVKHETDKGPAGADVDTKKGKGTPAHGPKVSETEEGRGENPGQHTEMPDDKLVNNPNADQQADARVDDKLKGKKKTKSRGEPTKKGKEPNKKADPEMEDDATPSPKGKDTKKAEAPHKDEKKKVRAEVQKSESLNPEAYGPDGKSITKSRDKAKKVTPKKKTPPTVAKAEVGDWVRNGQNYVGVVTGISDSGNPIVKVPAGYDQAIESHGWKVIVKASEVDENDPAQLLKQEMRILNSSEALAIFGQPTPEGQRARNCAIALSSVDHITPDGQSYFKDLFGKALAGKAVAKVESIDKLGSRELIDMKISDGPMTFFVMVEVFRDGDGKVHGVRMLQENLPVEVLKDFAGFLRNLAKEAPEKSESAYDATVAGEKLDRCVAQVKKDLTKKFREKNGKEPSAEKKKDIESSAFAICRDRGLK